MATQDIQEKYPSLEIDLRRAVERLQEANIRLSVSSKAWCSFTLCSVSLQVAPGEYTLWDLCALECRQDLELLTSRIGKVDEMPPLITTRSVRPS